MILLILWSLSDERCFAIPNISLKMLSCNLFLARDVDFLCQFVNVVLNLFSLQHTR